MSERLPTGMLERIMLVLGTFDADHVQRTQAEIVRSTGLSQSAVQRIVAELTSAGMLTRIDRSHYVIGNRLWELGELSPLSIRLREQSLPHLIQLYEETGENVHLGVLVGDSPATAEALYVARVAGRRSIPTLSRMGGRHTLHATGVGKALLAAQSDAWLDEFLEQPLVRETAHTITDAAQLRQDLVQARARGFALTREEMSLGSYAIGVMVPAVKGLPPIALGLVSHLARREVERYARRLQTTARDIAADVALA